MSSRYATVHQVQAAITESRPGLEQVQLLVTIALHDIEPPKKRRAKKSRRS